MTIQRNQILQGRPQWQRDAEIAFLLDNAAALSLAARRARSAYQAYLLRRLVASVRSRVRRDTIRRLYAAARSSRAPQMASRPV